MAPARAFESISIIIFVLVGCIGAGLHILGLERHSGDAVQVRSLSMGV